MSSPIFHRRWTSGNGYATLLQQTMRKGGRHMSYRLIAVDLDGTLLNSRKEIPEDE